MNIDDLAGVAFRTASYCTDPICKAHELYRRIAVVEALNPAAGEISHLISKILLSAELVGWACISLFTTALGVVLREVGSHLQTSPFICEKGEAEEKILPAGRSFSLFSWNVCCVGAGYTISDGGVMPWSFRIDKIAREILKQDADINCLYETFDMQSGMYLSEKLKQQGYSHIYFNIGPRAVGVSSGIFVASKYEIKAPEFIPFSQDALVGRTKNATKGVFSFDVVSNGESFARIYTTHLQHSEEPEFPTREEVEARKKEMQVIIDKVNGVRDRCIIVTGDLNLDDAEYQASSWAPLFQKGDAFGSHEKTWDGDEFCARMVGKRISGPLNLDHTMVVNGTARSLNTSLIPTGYDPKIFSEKATSDHKGLFSQIALV